MITGRKQDDAFSGLAGLIGRKTGCMFFPALLSGPGKKDNLDFTGGLFRYVPVPAKKMEVKWTG
jgi:hypothetical protein